MMRKQFVGIATVFLIVALGAVTASAQVDIGLYGSGSVTFTGEGSPHAGNDLLTFGGCSADPSGHCWSGSAAGTAGSSILSGASWEINFAPAGTVTMNDSTGDITQHGAAVLTIKEGSTTLLTGTLQLVNLGQLGGSGYYNYNMAANFTVTGGTLKSDFFGGTGVTQITIAISGGMVTLLKPGGQIIASFYEGSLTSAPEPSSMLLLGSGLVMLGGVLRRRLASQP
jgi:hypothetical protein